MAITFTQEKKKQRYLILALALIILVALGIIWWGFFSAPDEEAPPLTLTFKKIIINFDILGQDQLRNLSPFQGIPDFEEESGRENPFSPY